MNGENVEFHFHRSKVWFIFILSEFVNPTTQNSNSSEYYNVVVGRWLGGNSSTTTSCLKCHDEPQDSSSKITFTEPQFYKLGDYNHHPIEQILLK